MYNEHRKLMRLKNELQEKETEMVNLKFRVAANPTVSVHVLLVITVFSIRSNCFSVFSNTLYFYVQNLCFVVKIRNNVCKNLVYRCKTPKR